MTREIKDFDGVPGRTCIIRWIHDDDSDVPGAEACLVDIRQQTPVRWADGGPIIGRASLWAIDQPDAEYRAQVEDDLIGEAREDVQTTVKAIADGWRDPMALPGKPNPRGWRHA